MDYQYFAQASSLSLGAGLYTVKIQFAKHAGASEVCVCEVFDVKCLIIVYINSIDGNSPVGC